MFLVCDVHTIWNALRNVLYIDESVCVSAFYNNSPGKIKESGNKKKKTFFLPSALFRLVGSSWTNRFPSSLREVRERREPLAGVDDPAHSLAPLVFFSLHQMGKQEEHLIGDVWRRFSCETHMSISLLDVQQRHSDALIDSF